MVKKVRTTKKAGPSSSWRGVHQWVFIVAALIVGYFLSVFFEYSSRSEWASYVQFKLIGDKVAGLHAPVTPVLPKPRFEFYTLLNHDAAIAKTTSMVRDKPDTFLQPAQHQPAYLVQLAAFKQRDEADRVKAELILKGFQVNVSPSIQRDVIWYRVIVGPYSSMMDAEHAKNGLARSLRLTGIIRKVGV